MFYPMNQMRLPNQEYQSYPYQPPYPQQPLYWQNIPQQGQQFGQMPQQNTGAPPNGASVFPSQQWRPKANINLMNAFKNEEGKFDFEKTAMTIDQVMKVGNQISPLVKQVGAIFSKK